MSERGREIVEAVVDGERRHGLDDSLMTERFRRMLRAIAYNIDAALAKERERAARIVRARSGPFVHLPLRERPRFVLEFEDLAAAILADDGKEKTNG